jgi:protein-L-isoaspartate(D-aspartate) O-methyltransferase
VTDWVDRQLARRGIVDERLLAAMRQVPRELFVPQHERAHAYDDAALLLGHGQTISQPYIVALICQALRLRGDERVLDVGTGSGYQAAVLAELAGEVVSIERIPELSELAGENLAAAGYAERVELRVGNGWDGVPDRAPFAGIAVAAAASEPPPALVEQLAPEGRLVIPLGRSVDQWLVSVERTGRIRTLAAARFVPLVDYPR